MPEFNTETTQLHTATILLYGAAKKRVIKYIWSGMECQLLRICGQTKQLEIQVTLLPNVKNEQLLFVTLDFKP
jgi:hypothetical protein